MNYAKRLFFVGIVVFEILTVVMGLIGVEVCIDSQPIPRGDFIAKCTKQEGGIEVEVECHGDDLTTFSDFKFNLEYVSKTTFINCSYAENTSLIKIFRTMNISYSDEIQFESHRSPFSRQNFQNLSVPRLRFTETNFSISLVDMLYDVLGIERLTFYKTDLYEIPNNFFKNWSRDIDHVDLMGNKLRNITKNYFTHLPVVEYLNLSENEIIEIEAGAFDHLPRLTTLELSKNRLRTLPSGIFRHLSRLIELSLGENSFDQLPEDLLLIPDCKLENFRMNFNRGTLRTLPDQLFKNLLYLTDVNLESSKLESLPENLFVGSSQLKSLILRKNFLRGLPFGFFKNNLKLASLDLSNNQIVTLPARIFKNLSGLEDLNISYNNLSFLESDVFEGLGRLKKLDASHNELTKVGDGFCKHLLSIKIIDFSFNRLKFEVQKSAHASGFEGCKTLRKVSLSHNNIARIITEFAFYSAPIDIDLSFNNISQLTTGDLEKLRYAKTFDLRNNQISKINLTELASVVAHYKNYDKNFLYQSGQIALENNPLSCDCHLIDFVRYWKSEPESDLRRYVELTSAIDESAIAENACVPSHKVNKRNISCASPPKWKNSHIGSIQPEDLYCTLKTDAADDACTNDCICHEYPAKKVLSVNCSNENLTRFPSMISNVRNWSIELNMSHNALQQISPLKISYLPNVTSLDLSHNNISTITTDLFSKNLGDLKLHNNRISRLDEIVIKYLTDNKTLHGITLHENPWLCECEDRPFLYFIQPETSIVNGRDGIVCHKTNRKLYKMTPSDICPTAVAIIVGASLLIAFFGIITGVLAALYYKYQREVKVWLYSKQWCLWFVTEDELDKDKKYDAFVSFSHKDEDFVENEIVAKLEDGPRPYKLCLHYRDWLAGEWIPVQISQSVEDSRRTIVVLSSNFLESVWAKLEFRAAHTQALKEGRARLIIILYGEIENMDDLDPELKSYLSLNTYLKWGDPWFWDKLRYALPHRFEPSRRRTRNARLIEDQLLRQPASCNNPNAISLSKLANDSAKLLDSGVNERTTASC